LIIICPEAENDSIIAFTLSSITFTSATLFSFFDYIIGIYISIYKVFDVDTFLSLVKVILKS